MTKKGPVFTALYVACILALAGVFFVSAVATARAEESASLAVSDEVTSSIAPVVPPGGGCSSNCGPTDPVVSLAISEEISTKTLSTGGCTSNCGSNPSIAISDEISAKTLSTGGCTSNCGGNPSIAISEEISATTLSSGGGCTSNCGSGSGGSSGGHSGGRRQVVTPVAPTSCPLYLTKYIRYGYNNDPWEVLKLQVFLRTYEGFSNVPTSGFYDKVTEEAVRAFQVRYGQDVLNPWGLGAMEPTGYVFITTTYAINQIYCNRTTANNFDLRQVYPNSGTVSGVKDGGQIGNIDHGFIASTTATSTKGIFNTIASSTKGLFQAGAAGLVSFITNHPGVWLTILLLLALLVLLYLIWKLRDEEGVEVYEVTDPESDPAMADLHDPMLPLVIEEETLPDEELIIDESDDVAVLEDRGTPPPDLPVEKGSKDNE